MFEKQAFKKYLYRKIGINFLAWLSSQTDEEFIEIARDVVLLRFEKVLT